MMCYYSDVLDAGFPGNPQHCVLLLFCYEAMHNPQCLILVNNDIYRLIVILLIDIHFKFTSKYLLCCRVDCRVHCVDNLFVLCFYNLCCYNIGYLSD